MRKFKNGLKKVVSNYFIKSGCYCIPDFITASLSHCELLLLLVLGELELETLIILCFLSF